MKSLTIAAVVIGLSTVGAPAAGAAVHGASSSPRGQLHAVTAKACRPGLPTPRVYKGAVHLYLRKPGARAACVALPVGRPFTCEGAPRGVKLPAIKVPATSKLPRIVKLPHGVKLPAVGKLPAGLHPRFSRVPFERKVPVRLRPGMFKAPSKGLPRLQVPACNKIKRAK